MPQLSHCPSCQAPLSMPATCCQACGFPFTLSDTMSADRFFTAPHHSDTRPAPSATGPAGGGHGVDPQDEARLAALLGQIAAQSHFEERYELRGRLNMGGMGGIFRAHDRVLRREVAVKMMNEGLQAAESQARGQFLKEARVGARLLHPHVLPVFDLGVNRPGQIYFTMRLVDGGSLKDCLDALDRAAGTRLIAYPLRKVVEAFVRACLGVDYAHQNGVIHLDLKPQNVLVSGFNEVFVIDWGLARVDDVDDTDRLLDLYRNWSGDSSTSNQTGAYGNRVVGTAPYMAPEQMTGDVASFDPTTDVYGLGGILYFALYSEAPNRGRDLSSMYHSAIQPKARGKLRPGILPRGQRVNREVREAVEALEGICLKAVTPDRAVRYADVEKMILDLNDWLANTPPPPAGL